MHWASPLLLTHFIRDVLEQTVLFSALLSRRQLTITRRISHVMAWQNSLSFTRHNYVLSKSFLRGGHLNKWAEMLLLSFPVKTLFAHIRSEYCSDRHYNHRNFMAQSAHLGPKKCLSSSSITWAYNCNTHEEVGSGEIKKHDIQMQILRILCALLTPRHASRNHGDEYALLFVALCAMVLQDSEFWKRHCYWGFISFFHRDFFASNFPLSSSIPARDWRSWMP